MFAMLLEMTWTLSSWAIIPVAAVCSARMVMLPQASGRDVGQPLDRGAAQFGLLLQHARDVGVGAGEFDHAGHLDNGANVRELERALHDAHVGWRLRGYARRRRERRCAV